MYAIFKEDIPFKNFPLYRLNEKTGRFEMDKDPEIHFSFLEVVHGEDFILVVEDEPVVLVR